MNNVEQTSKRANEQPNTVPFLVSIVLLFYCSIVLSFSQRPDIEIYPRPREATKLAVADFVARTTATQETESALKVFNGVLWKDLEFSAFFEMPSKSFYPLRPLRGPRDVEFENWQVPSLDVDFLIFGNLQARPGHVVVEAYLYDVKTHQQVLGKRYLVDDATLVRRVVHEFSDQVVFQLSAGTSKGVARTWLAYTAMKGASKEIHVADYDGWNERTITANGGINKFPEWSPDRRKLVFITKLVHTSRWELWIQNLEGGKQVLPISSSYVSSPAFAPDETRVAFSSRAEGRVDSDLFVMDIGGSKARNVTRHPGIDTSPTWSPTGQQIAFISDRSGSPQLWIIDSDGSNLQRLVSEGGHCDSPDWSPDGRFVTYSWQARGRWKHDIYMIEVATKRMFQLTSGGASNESPHWSPDGRHIAFQSTRTGSKQIFIMNADGKNLRQVTTYGANGSPDWSGYAEP